MIYDHRTDNGRMLDGLMSTANACLALKPRSNDTLNTVDTAAEVFVAVDFSLFKLIILHSYWGASIDRFTVI